MPLTIVAVTQRVLHATDKNKSFGEGKNQNSCVYLYRHTLLCSHLCIIRVLYYPHVLPPALLDAPHPLATVALSSVMPVHSTIAMALVVVPLPLIHITRSEVI